MTVFYLIRHGTTDANASGRFQGSLDLPLNAIGLKQAAYLGERFKNIPIDFLYASPLTRAVQTAKGLRGNVHRLPISIEKDLVEVDGGLIEGKLISEIDAVYPGLMETFRTDLPHFDSPEGESTRDVYNRMVSVINRIVTRHPGKTIACVSHGFAIQTFLCWAEGTPFEQMRQHILGNTGVCRFIFNGNALPQIDYIGDESHLPDDLHFAQPGGFRVDE